LLVRHRLTIAREDSGAVSKNRAQELSSYASLADIIPNSDRAASLLKAKEYVPIADIREALCRATSPLSVPANGQRLDKWAP
jgi:hypothetical protein